MVWLVLIALCTVHGKHFKHFMVPLSNVFIRCPDFIIIILYILCQIQSILSRRLWFLSRSCPGNIIIIFHGFLSPLCRHPSRFPG